MLLRITFLSALLACFLLSGFALESKKKRPGETDKEKKLSSLIRAKKDFKVGRGTLNTFREVTKDAKVRREKKIEALTRNKDKETLSSKRGTVPRKDVGCASIGGICQRSSYICQGRYLKDKCTGPETHQCCLPAGAWSVLCDGYHNNRVRACDVFGCGGFNSRRDGDGVRKGVDVVCDDYGVVNAPFSGTLGGPVAGVQYDGVILSNSEHCVKIFNIRPYRYTGPVSQGESLGYLLPLQDRFSGITSHLELQMCDHSDPTPYI
ncbi:hypothetical protein DPEC_G00226410 [Dallia pectoralis]|uniref:Uncharacterized protein n=1 Tax=Dallia pectoralis TaxID=75939 RepID=A0ACC2G0C5_DALPE|nr:hypothetical protein DPEC_G00226410 [Dallia pectoralis]